MYQQVRRRLHYCCLGQVHYRNYSKEVKEQKELQLFYVFLKPHTLCLLFLSPPSFFSFRVLEVQYCFDYFTNYFPFMKADKSWRVPFLKKAMHTNIQGHAWLWKYDWQWQELFCTEGREVTGAASLKQITLFCLTYSIYFCLDWKEMSREEGMDMADLSSNNNNGGGGEEEPRSLQHWLL